MKGNVVLAAIILSIGFISTASIIAIAISKHNSQISKPQLNARYQVAVGSNRAFIIDTNTGQSWEKFLSSHTGSTSGGFNQPKRVLK